MFGVMIPLSAVLMTGCFGTSDEDRLRELTMQKITPYEEVNIKGIFNIEYQPLSRDKLHASDAILNCIQESHKDVYQLKTELKETIDKSSIEHQKNSKIKESLNTFNESVQNKEDIQNALSKFKSQASSEMSTEISNLLFEDEVKHVSNIREWNLAVNINKKTNNILIPIGQKYPQEYKECIYEKYNYSTLKDMEVKTSKDGKSSTVTTKLSNGKKKIYSYVKQDENWKLSKTSNKNEESHNNLNLDKKLIGTYSCKNKSKSATFELSKMGQFRLIELDTFMGISGTWEKGMSGSSNGDIILHVQAADGTYRDESANYQIKRKKTTVFPGSMPCEWFRKDTSLDG